MAMSYFNLYSYRLQASFKTHHQKRCGGGPHAPPPHKNHEPRRRRGERQFAVIMQMNNILRTSVGADLSAPGGCSALRIILLKFINGSPTVAYLNKELLACLCCDASTLRFEVYTTIDGGQHFGDFAHNFIGGFVDIFACNLIAFRF